MKINVTAEDIAQGDIGSVDNCPVARAMSRALQRPVLVGLVYVLQPFYLELPRFAYVNILKLALDEHVEPFSFDLEIPCKSV